MIKIILSYLVLLLSSCQLFGQFGSDLADLNDKYWYYRYRLDAFRVIGSEQGQSIPASTRWGQFERISWGQETPRDLGAYLGVLATEYKLLELNNLNGELDEDMANTLTELYYAVIAANRLDEIYETQNVWVNQNNTGLLDGSFARNDVAAGESLLVYGLEALNEMIYQLDVDVPIVRGDWEDAMGHCDDPNDHPTTMSHDKIYALLVGLTLVVKSLPDNNLTVVNLSGNNMSFNFHDWAQSYIVRTIDYMSSDPWWIIHNPDGAPDGCSSPGGAFAYRYATKEIKQTFGNSNITHHPSEFVTWDIAVRVFSINHHNKGMALNLAALCNCLKEDTEFLIDSLGTIDNHAPFFLLLWQYLHDESKVLPAGTWDQLYEAPSCGPGSIRDVIRLWDWGGGNPNFPNNYLPQNWRAPYKWTAATDVQNDLVMDGGVNTNQSRGLHNGLDYMLFYNLFRLNYSSQTSIPYGSGYQRRDRTRIHDFYPSIGYDISNNVAMIGMQPNTFTLNGYYDIESSSEIGQTGSVEFRSGVSIKLEPSFKATYGSHFRAYVDPFTCSQTGGEEVNIYSRGPKTKTTIQYVEDVKSLSSEYSIPKIIPVLNSTSSTSGNNNEVHFSNVPAKQNTRPEDDADLYAIYPNPAIGVQTISTNFTGSYKIYNAYGSIVAVGEDASSILISELANGTYFIHAANSRAKFIVIN